MNKKNITIIAGILFALLFGFMYMNKGSVAPEQQITLEQKDLNTYSVEEIATHDNEGDCWFIIENKVYDVTNYIGMHPGGTGIKALCGQDATAAFMTKGAKNEPHSEKAQNFKESMLIGTVAK